MDYHNSEETRKYVEAQDAFYAKYPDFVRERMYKLLGEVKDKSILDLGCGVGKDVSQLSEMGALVIGFDNSQSMLDIAAERYPTLKRSFINADFVEGFPFEDQKFDLIFVRYALHYAHNLDPVFAEMSRVLKPGGGLVACVAHPLLGFIAKGCKDYFDQKEFSIDLYDSTVTITEMSHTFSDYFSPKILRWFDVCELVEPIPASNQKNENAFKARIAEGLIFKMVKR